MGRKLSYNEFIRRAKIQHCSKYDYTNVELRNTHTPVQIICPVHGAFMQRPDAHLSGRGCKLCSVKQKDTVDFIRECELIHGEKYIYSQVEYRGYNTKITVICRKHGSFEQRANNHLSGCGCPECGNEVAAFTSKQRTKSTTSFVFEANVKHGKKYNYHNTVYVNKNTKILITCPEHGDFSQTPYSHLSGCGCPYCADKARIETIRKPLSEFIEEANKYHNGKYDYSNTIYQNSTSKVSITCYKHGVFRQLPRNHLYGHGCPRCQHNISKGETEWLDSLDVEARQIKINLVNGKYIVADGYDHLTNTVYEFNGDYYHGNPNKYSPAEINPTNHKTFGELYDKTLLKEKSIRDAGYNLIVMWESDWYYNKKNGDK